MVTLKHNREHNCKSKQCQIAQIIMLHFVENADFITIHAGLLPLAQNAQKGD